MCLGGSDYQQNDILEGIQRSSTINSILNGDADIVGCDQVTNGVLQRPILKVKESLKETTTKRNCSVCSCSMSSNDSIPCTIMTGETDNSKALVPFQESGGSSSSVSLLVKDMPDPRPGWPLLKCTLLSEREDVVSSSPCEISVVQWANLLPTRSHLSTVKSSLTAHNHAEQEDDSCDQGVPDNVMIPVSDTILSDKTSLSGNSRNAPTELEGLHEKYSSTCRMFKYKELQSATSNFMPGLTSRPIFHLNDHIINIIAYTNYNICRV